MKEKLIKVLIVKPLKQPRVVYIPNSLNYFNRLVNQDTYLAENVDVLVLENDVGILRNREGALLDLKGNREVNSEIIAGTFLVVGIDRNGFIVSLSDNKIEKYLRRFEKAEQYTDIETLNSYWNKFEESIEAME